MRYEWYIDVDRQGNGFLIKVKHDTNKKGEPVDTVVLVKHLGKVRLGDVILKYIGYPLWDRAIESGDYLLLK